MKAVSCLVLVVLLFEISQGFGHQSSTASTFRQESLKKRKFDLRPLASSTISSASYPVKQSWPCGDELDKKILTLAAPAVLNFAIVPLVGAVDTFFVGRMNNALALAGQGAANQVFSSLFWIISFLPSIVTPLVAKAAGAGDKEAVQNHISEAIFLGIIMGLVGTSILMLATNRALQTVLSLDSPALAQARPYLFIRAFTFIPTLLSTVAFAAFRGNMDVITPLKISLISNLVNVIFDPIMIFNMKMGVAGAAVATCFSELTAFFLYGHQLISRQMLQMKSFMKIPSFSRLKPLLLGGLSVQMRAVAMNIAFLAVTRTTQRLDKTGTMAAAHAITLQFWQLGGMFLFAMSTVGSIIVPAELAKARREGDPEAIWRAKRVSDRMILWGVILGSFLAVGQLLCLPLLNVFTPLEEVQKAARTPAIIGAILQVINGVVFIGEGIQQGNQYFPSLAVATALATTGMLTSLKFFGTSLPGVWGSFAVFNAIRLLGVLRHNAFESPFAPRNMPARTSPRKDEVAVVSVATESHKLITIPEIDN